MPCTCGELIQGTQDGLPFLVSCPIDSYSRVKVTITRGQGDHERRREAPGGYRRAGVYPLPPRIEPETPDAGLSPAIPSVQNAEGDKPLPYTSGRAGQPPALPEKVDRVCRAPGRNGKPGMSSTVKAYKAAASALKYLGLENTPFDLEVSCPLPPSKGFGSSTADVVGAISAIAEAVGRPLSPAEIARLAVAVEPSDSTMFPGLAVIDHRGCRRWEELGPAPPLLVAVLDFEGTVDTEDYNARLDLSTVYALESEHSRALELLRKGLRYHRLDLIGEAATASARANQLLLPKSQLEAVIALGIDCRAIGVCAAHSGTALGVLFASNEMEQATRFQERAEKKLEELSCSWVATMVDGGARVPLISAWKKE